MRRKPLVAVLVGALVASVGVAAAATSASAAAPCSIGVYSSATYDYARTTDGSGTCTQVGAAHYFTPWGGGSMFTGWKYDGTAAQTGVARELTSGRHTGY